MGGKNLDRWSAEDWRATAETVEKMIARGWKVMSVCSACPSKRWTDLRVIARTKGRTYSLWNKTASCRQVGCEGVVHFVGVPPGMGTSHTVRLRAEWVGDRRYPPGAR